MIAQTNTSQTLSRKPSAKDKPRASRKLDSHEITLARLKREGSSVLIATMGGDEVVGKLVDFDRYSIGIRESVTSPTKFVFKSAIQSFEQYIKA
ncbi:hypothetical protein [Shewanella glacialipiscicola]|uniref:hypothetical protein n=1 Tax=Shewanella glacialipiscicola TaxID=614069 RepID=UPI003D7A47F6